MHCQTLVTKKLAATDSKLIIQSKYLHHGHISTTGINISTSVRIVACRAVRSDLYVNTKHLLVVVISLSITSVGAYGTFCYYYY